MSNIFKGSNSKVKTWRRCHYAYHLKYVEKLRAKRKSRPLTFGELAHKMIEAHAEGDDPFDVLKQLDPKQLRLFEVERESYGNLLDDLRVIMTEYFKHWGEDSVQYLRLNKRSAEHEFEVEIEDGLVVTGKIDAFVRTPNKLRWLMEHKTFTNRPNEDQFWRNVQSILYTRISQMMGWFQVEGTLWDYIRSKPPAFPQVMKNGKLSKRSLDTLPTRLKEFAQEKGLKVARVTMASATKNRERYFQRVFTPTKPELVDKVFADFIETLREMRDLHGRSKAKNIDRHCDWCEFEPICRAELRGGDADFIKEKYFDVREDENLPPKRSIQDIVAHPPGIKHPAQHKRRDLRSQRQR